jgi:transcription factor C subunit 7
VLASHFAFLDLDYASVCEPSTHGESIPTLHARVAYSLARLIRALDDDPKGPRAVVLCSHAATIIVMGRVLTGRMPDDPFEDDVKCGTCSLSVYKRRVGDLAKAPLMEAVGAEGVPVVKWKGVGVGGGWDCVANGDCSFLSGGEERGWYVTGVFGPCWRQRLMSRQEILG